MSSKKKPALSFKEEQVILLQFIRLARRITASEEFFFALSYYMRLTEEERQHTTTTLLVFIARKRYIWALLSQSLPSFITSEEARDDILAKVLNASDRSSIEEWIHTTGFSWSQKQRLLGLINHLWGEFDHLWEPHFAHENEKSIVGPGYETARLQKRRGNRGKRWKNSQRIAQLSS